MELIAQPQQQQQKYHSITASEVINIILLAHHYCYLICQNAIIVLLPKFKKSRRINESCRLAVALTVTVNNSALFFPYHELGGGYVEQNCKASCLRKMSRTNRQRQMND